jgi:hypothetical protein
MGNTIGSTTVGWKASTEIQSTGNIGIKWEVINNDGV